MCGIATISIGRRSRGRISYPLLRKLTKELLYELQPRGIDASGIAIINEQGSGVNSLVFKKPLRPRRFVKRQKFEEVLGHIGPQTNFILLHARATTAGSASDNFNNHPIVVSPVVGIHNGTLFNEGRLFARFQTAFKREGAVDSEIIFRLYHYYTDVMGFSPQEAMVATSDKLIGAYTGAIVDTRFRDRMTMFKFERSLCLFRIPHYDMVIAISEPGFYDQAARRLGIKARETCRYVKDGIGFTIDLNIEGRISDSIEDFEIPVKRTLSLGRQHNPWLITGYR